MSIRETIVKGFAEWTDFSATRSGCLIKSRKNVYPLIRLPHYNLIFLRESITQEEFDKWHRDNILRICEKNDKLPIDWETKLIDIYLKIRIYLVR